MTDYIFDGLLILLAIVSLFQDSASHMRKNLIAIAIFGVIVSVAYAFLLKGNPVWTYLSSYFGSAFNELGNIFAGMSASRPLFSNQTAIPVPIWDRLLIIASVVLVAFGLPFGLLSLWQQHRHNALAVTLGIASLTYPLSQVFRFTEFGSEITDRSSAFLFLPNAFILTIFITHFWPTRKLTWRATSLITCALSVIFLGGALLEAGAGYTNLPGPYIVVDDLRSIEPEGIQSASWALAHLGPDNRVGTDRINQMLMSTYGHQRVITYLDDSVDIVPVFFSSHLDPSEVAVLRQAKIRYLVIDLRLSTALPFIGFYFEASEPDAFRLTSPISREALTKFSAIPGVNRVFDSGNIVIYDVGTLVNGP